MKKHIFIAGSSGLVGGLVFNDLISSKEVNRQYDLIEVGRRSVNKSEKAVFFETDFVQFKPFVFSKPDDRDLEKNEVIGICCLGTTIKKAGSPKAFEAVDYEYVIQFAKWLHQMGGRKFIVVTAMGADPKSTIFYNQVKGRVEADLQKIGFESLAILRPSLLLGERSEKRFSERLAIQISPLVSWLFVGALKKYQPIQAKDVAKCIVKKTFSDWSGCIILQSDEISNEVKNA